MCFYKTKESKVLVAKRDIKVYKLGTYADDDSFNPFFYKDFKYSVNQTVFEKVEFTNIIEQGLHSYIMCKLAPFATAMDLFSCGNFLYPLSTPAYAIYLGKFIIPKGATYCLNRNGEVVSDVLVYTGKYVELNPYKQYNTKELWKEKQVKYLLIMVRLMKQ